MLRAIIKSYEATVSKLHFLNICCKGAYKEHSALNARKRKRRRWDLNAQYVNVLFMVVCTEDSILNDQKRKWRRRGLISLCPNVFCSVVYIECSYMKIAVLNDKRMSIKAVGFELAVSKYFLYRSVHRIQNTD